MGGTIGTICARGGSKGLPGKNLRPLLKKPLIEHTIEQALRCREIDAGVFVSTDDPEIANLAKSAGAIVPFLRPAELATDSAGKIAVIDHLQAFVLEQGVSFDRIVDMDPTCPLRSDSDINGCISLLTDEFDVVYSVCEARKNPYFNMVELDKRGFARLVCVQGDIPVHRQGAPTVYEINGAVYVWHRQTLKKGLWGGNARLYEMPTERSIDIDSELDFTLVELLMQRRMLAN